MNSRKVDDLVKELSKIQSILSDLGVSEGVITREVKSFGNGGHVVIPKQYINKQVRVIIG